MDRVGSQRIIGDSWYATAISGLCVPLDEVLRQRCSVWLQNMARCPGFMRSLLLFVFGRGYELTVITRQLRGTGFLILLETLFGGGRRRLMILEFMPTPPSRHSVWSRWLDGIFTLCVLKPGLRRCLCMGQVLTMWERNHYAKKYNLPAERFEYVPWPQRRETDPIPNFDRGSPFTVLSSGRFGCDWVTLFRAAEGRGWNLTVICAPWDVKFVRSLAQKVEATVLCNLSAEEHQRHLEASAVYVISLQEEFLSCGQVRVMNAIRAGIPIVATNVVGLEGYLADDETAVLVDHGDPSAMRQAVERLLAFPDEGRRLAMKAFGLAKHRTFGGYLEQIRSFVHRELEPRG